MPLNYIRYTVFGQLGKYRVIMYFKGLSKIACILYRAAKPRQVLTP